MRRRWFLEEEDLPSPEARAANLLGALAVGLSDRILGALETSMDLSASSIAVLQAIHERPGLSIEDLRRMFGVSQATAARLASGLVSRGLVLRERDRRDARAVSLRTSELGGRHALRASIARSRLTGEMVRRLPRVWVPRLIRIAERLLAALAAEPGAADRICRFCAWATCRADPTAPCPVVLATTSHDCSTRTTFDGLGDQLFQDRRIIDGADPPIELWLEPGGAVFHLPAGRRLEILCRGPQHGHLEVERLLEGHLALYAWPGATFTVLEAGREIFVEERALSLNMAEGGTTRARVEFLYGDFRTRRGQPPARWR